MEAAAVKAVVEGLKQAGVDFISLLPDSDFSDLQHRSRATSTLLMFQ